MSEIQRVGDFKPNDILFEKEQQYCIVSKEAFAKVSDYTRSQPTTPAPGRVYRKNLGWPTDRPDNWFIYICERDPEDATYVLHHGRKVLLV